MFFFFDKIFEKHIKTADKIYHYTSINALKNIISESKLWLTDYRFLNDYNEFEYGLNIFKDVLKMTNKLPKLMKEQILNRLSSRMVNYKNLDYMESSVFILSFSLDQDNKDLWNYYTKDNFGFGYNFEIEPNKLKTDFLDLKRNALSHNSNFPLFHIPHGKIVYNLEKQKAIFSDAIDAIITSHPTGVGVVSDICEEILKLCFFMKSSDFMNENEYRIAIMFPSDKLKKFTNPNSFPKYFFTENYGSFIPRLELIFNLNSIKSITISPYNKMDFTAIGLEEFLKSKNMKISTANSKIKLRF